VNDYSCIYDNKRITVTEYREKLEVKRFEDKLRDHVKECVNFRDGICAVTDERCSVLNEGFPLHTCRRCNYFERFVLPSNEKLHADYWLIAQGDKLQTVAKRQCAKCGVYIEMTSPRRKYCDVCKRLAERDANRQRKQRERARKEG
jgi:hypothetical protein